MTGEEEVVGTEDNVVVVKDVDRAEGEVPLVCEGV